MRNRSRRSQVLQDRAVRAVVLVGVALCVAFLTMTLRGSSEATGQEDLVTLADELPLTFDDVSGAAARGVALSGIGPVAGTANDSQDCDRSDAVQTGCGSPVSEGAVASTDRTASIVASNTLDQSPSFARATPSPGIPDDRSDSARTIAGSLSQSTTAGGASPRSGRTSAGGGAMGGGTGSGGSTSSGPAGTDKGTTDKGTALGAQLPSGRLSLAGDGSDAGEVPPVSGSNLAQAQGTDPHAPIGSPSTGDPQTSSQGSGGNESLEFGQPGGGTEGPGLQSPTFIEELALGGASETGFDQSGPSGSAQEPAAFQGQEAADVANIVVATPEPASLVLFGSGLALAAWRIRRQQSKPGA